MSVILTKPYRGIQIDKFHPLSKGLVNCVVLNEGSGVIASDACHASNGTVVNGTWDASGLLIPADNGWVELRTTYDPLAGTTKFTIVAKMRVTDAIDGDRGIFYTGDHAGGEAILLWFDNAGPDHISANVEAGVNPGTLDSSLVPVSATWYTIILVYDGSFIRLYINGIEDTAGDFPNPRTGVLIAKVGGDSYTWANSNSADKGLRGRMQFGMIYKRALSPMDVKKITADPFQMFKKETPIYLFEAGGPVIGQLLMHAGTDGLGSYQHENEMSGGINA